MSEGNLETTVKKTVWQVRIKGLAKQEEVEMLQYLLGQKKDVPNFEAKYDPGQATYDWKFSGRLYWRN